MKFNLSLLERRQLIMWAEGTIGGLFGGSELAFPEERITLDTLMSGYEENIDISERALRIMMIWCKNAIGSSSSNRDLTSEESSLLFKLKKAEKDFNVGNSAF